MSEVTIEITNYCENECIFCSSKSNPEGSHLDITSIKSFLDSYPKNSIATINISGGEPLAHPEFYKIFKLCKQYTSNVWVYTNLINKLAYNTHVLEQIEIRANIPLVPGLKVNIPSGVIFQNHFLKFVPQGRGKNIKTVSEHFSGICSFNGCSNCDNKTLKADGTIVPSPCKKDYQEKKVKNDQT